MSESEVGNIYVKYIKLYIISRAKARADVNYKKKSHIISRKLKQELFKTQHL